MKIRDNFCSLPEKCRGIVIALVGSVCRLHRRRRAKTLTFSNISIITEDIYLKLSLVVYY